MQKEIKLGIVVGFALLLAILLVWYKSGEQEKPASPGSAAIEEFIKDEKPAPTPPASQTEPLPLPPQTTPATDERPATEVKPAPAEETVVIPKTLPVEAKMGPSPVKPAPKTTAVAEAPKLPTHKPATEHPSAATRPHEGSAKEEARKEEAKKEEAEKETAETEARKPAAATAEQTYVVQPGDNLHKIAAKFYGDERKWRVILEANKTVIPAANKLNAGTKIKIPASAPEAAKPAEAAPTAKKSTPKEETTAVKPAAKEAGGPKKYTVKAGDTLTSIAEQEYGDEEMVDKILAANKDTIKDKDKLFVGQVLTIPPK